MDRLQVWIVWFSLISVSASHAAQSLPAQDYWEKVLPNTPMPSAIRALISSAESLVTEVSKGSVHVGTSKDKSTGTDINVGHKGVGINVNGQQGNTQVRVGGGGVHVNTAKGTTVNVGHGGVTVNTGHNGKPPVAVNVGSFNYRYAASDTQIHDNPQVTLFFLEKDLHPDAKMKLNFAKAALSAAFIPQNEADSLPFSSIKLPEILSHFGIDPKSSEAETLKKTLQTLLEVRCSRMSKKSKMNPAEHEGRGGT